VRAHRTCCGDTLQRKESELFKREIGGIWGSSDTAPVADDVFR